MSIIQCADRAQWLEERRKSIGGSDAPVLFGESPWASPYSLWCEKTGLVEQSEDFEAMKPWLKSGQKMEAVILEMFREEVRPSRSTSLEPPFTICKSDILPMHATIDARQCKSITYDIRGIIQIKNVSAYKKKDWQDGVPRRVWVQCQHEMFCADTDLCSIAALINGSEFIWQDVARDKEFINEHLIPECQKFWEHVITETPPEVDAHPATEEALKAAWPQAQPETSVVLTGEFIQLDIDRQALNDEIKKHQTRLAEINNAFRAAMQDKEFGLLPLCKYSLKTQVRNAYEVKESTCRVLRRHEGGY